MSLDERLDDVLDVLGHSGFDEVEVFAKRGRSRTVRFGRDLQVGSLRQEEGWAVRAGDRRRSFFYCSSGNPNPDTPWPEADGRGLRLPSSLPVPSWSPAPDVDSSICGESEATTLFEGLARELDRELPGTKILRGLLEDGAAEQQIVSSREIRQASHQRLATLYLEVIAQRSQARFALQVAERSARAFQPAVIAQRMVDRLLIAERGGSTLRDRGDFLLAPPVMIALLAGLADLFIGPEAEKRLAAMARSGAAIGSKFLSLVDHGRLPGGLLDRPVDGEGLPTREIVLVEEGVLRQPLLAWHEAVAPARPSGCARRPGWRDLPEPGPTHFFLRPAAEQSVAGLLGGLARGYYLIGTTGPVKVEALGKRFAVPVDGYALEKGRATSAIHQAWLVGQTSSLFHGLVAVARDLSFQMARGGMIGAPSTLVRGLELRGQS